MLSTICALKAVATETQTRDGTINIIKLIKRLKTQYTLSKLIFANFGGFWGILTKKNCTNNEVFH